MLSKEDNEILCRVGPGTPMGNLLRQYWMPAFVSSELPVDGWPRKIRLLGEDLIAFRDSDGKVGVVAENCPHRGSSLIFGRNEESGIRCAYHGWKFDVNGVCVDMPSEGEFSNFKDKVKITAYPTQERNEIVWLYMGPRKELPPLPELEVNMGERRRPGIPFKYVRQCNWAQALEGDIDSVHLNFLHTRINQVSNITGADTNPHFEVVQTNYGHFFGARRTVGDKYYWRINQFAMPFYTAVTGPFSKVWMPIDDYNTLIMEFSPSRPPEMPRDYDDLANMANARQPWGYKPDDMTIPWGNWRLKADVDNEWMRDRSLEKGAGNNKLFLGIHSNPLQDSAVQVTMGALYDRTKEYLGTTDKAIIAFRRIMIQAAKAMRDRGEIPPTVNDGSLYAVRGFSAMLPQDLDWISTSEPWRKAFSAGVPQEYSAGGPGGPGGGRGAPQAGARQPAAAGGGD
jgi:phenylpropionate dioxygenase-like ring-hydroxylating dioxygenase large terminal subunit